MLVELLLENNTIPSLTVFALVISLSNAQIRGKSTDVVDVLKYDLNEQTIFVTLLGKKFSPSKSS